MDNKKTVIIIVVAVVGVALAIIIGLISISAKNVNSMFDKAKANALETSAMGYIQYFNNYYEKGDNVCYEINKEFSTKIGMPYYNYEGSIIFDGNESYIWLSGNGYMTSGKMNELNTVKSNEVIRNCNK